MGEIKSAWEIAMEKADKLEKLSPEQMRRQIEEKLATIGQFIAEKYLGGLDLWQMNVELDKHSGEDRDLLRDLVASKLASLIEMGNHDTFSRISEGISYLKPDSKVKETYAEIEQLFNEYTSAQRQAQEEISKSAGGVLQRLGISGSAVGSVNPGAKGEWQQESNCNAQPFIERLEQLKQKLTNIITA